MTSSAKPSQHAMRLQALRVKALAQQKLQEQLPQQPPHQRPHRLAPVSQMPQVPVQSLISWQTLAEAICVGQSPAWEH